MQPNVIGPCDLTVVSWDTVEMAKSHDKYMLQYVPNSVVAFQKKVN